MPFPRALFIPPLLLALFLAGSVARADDQSDLEKVRAAYIKHEYDDAAQRLLVLLDPRYRAQHDQGLLTQAQMYWGAVQLGKGDAEGATKAFEKLIFDDPSYEADPLSFPTTVIDLFIDTRARMRAELNAQAQERARRAAEQRAQEEVEKRRQVARLAMLEKLASEEKITELHSRWVAFVPFGVGQFQNGDKTLGWLFLGAESALVVGTLVALPIYLTDLQYRTEAYDQGDTLRAQEYVDRASTVRTVNLALAGACAVVGVAGVVQAQWAFVPERVVVKKRAIPDVAWAPLLAPEKGGVVAGMQGRF